jgi:hypothetical protein
MGSLPRPADIPEGHLVGKSISSSTYKNLGCRCEGCRVEAKLYQRKMRQRGGRIKAHDKAQSVATYRAGQWVREEFPRVWRKLYREALEDALLSDDFIPQEESVTPPEETVGQAGAANG